MQREASVLLEKLEAQGRQLAGLQHHQMQAAELTATLRSTTDALEKSQAELQQTASALEHAQHQLAQACVSASLQPELACQASYTSWHLLRAQKSGKAILRSSVESCGFAKHS